MRGCLVALAALVVVAVLVLWFALPLVVGGIATATLGAVGFHGTDTRVDVFADPPLRLLTLNADRVRVRSTDVTLENVAADTVDLTLRDVSINERRFGVIEGTLGGVTVTPDVGPPFEVSTVQLSGPSEAARATLTLGQRDGPDAGPGGRQVGLRRDRRERHARGARSGHGGDDHRPRSRSPCRE